MKISEINIYPIKSLGGISVEDAVVERRGLRYDRRYVLIDPEGRFISQREVSKLAVLALSLNEEGFQVAAPDGEVIQIPFKIEGDRKQVAIWDSVCDAVIADSIINRWFSDRLGRACELAHMPDDSDRLISEKFYKGSEIVSFADGYPILVIGQSSLDDLNSRMENGVPMNRFRPNIVLEGSDPFGEDRWKAIKIGESVFRSTKPCARCVVTTIDQSSGISTGNEPLRTLAKFRSAAQVFPETFSDLGLSSTSVLFGQNFVPENFGGAIKKGDTVSLP